MDWFSVEMGVIVLCDGAWGERFRRVAVDGVGNGRGTGVGREKGGKVGQRGENTWAVEGR